MSFITRKNILGKEYVVGYHTQECRYIDLIAPIRGEPEKAWLGIGYYFWTEEQHSRFWGKDRKVNKTGYYDVYTANLDTEKCIDAVFSEDGYTFFRENLSK